MSVPQFKHFVMVFFLECSDEHNVEQNFLGLFLLVLNGLKIDWHWTHEYMHLFIKCCHFQVVSGTPISNRVDPTHGCVDVGKVTHGQDVVIDIVH